MELGRERSRKENVVMDNCVPTFLISKYIVKVFW